MFEEFLMIVILPQSFPVYAGLSRELPENGVTEELEGIFDEMEVQMNEEKYSEALDNCCKAYNFLLTLGLPYPHAAHAKLAFQLNTVVLGLYGNLNSEAHR